MQIPYLARHYGVVTFDGPHYTLSAVDNAATRHIAVSFLVYERG
jgi:hypothetical protein